jgi:hypothetical protein
MELSKQVYALVQSDRDKSVELGAFLKAHAEVDVDLYRNADENDAFRGTQAIHVASERGHAACLRLLLEHGANPASGNSYSDTAFTLACMNGHTECMQMLLNDFRVDVNAGDEEGETGLHILAHQGKVEQMRMVLDRGAGVNNCNRDKTTPSMRACMGDFLPCVQLLLDNKADLDLREIGNQDALHYAIWWPAMLGPRQEAATPFGILSCNTDAKNVQINDDDVTQDIVDGHIAEYKAVHAFIDEHHSVLNKTLSRDVQVDTRLGLGESGIYQEPLERTLEYLGMSMNKDQVVNASIDGEGVKRALIPFHVLSAKRWYDKYQARAQ